MARAWAFLKVFFRVRDDPMNGERMHLKETANRAQHYNKGLAAAAVTVLAFVTDLFGFEIPAEVQGALITLAVVVIPNR